MAIQSQMINPANTHRASIKQIEQVVFVNTCMHGTTTNEKRGHESEREQGLIYGRVWRAQKGRGNDIIKSILKNKTFLKVESSKGDLFIVATLGRGTKRSSETPLKSFCL